jgi:hypothetical protein
MEEDDGGTQEVDCSAGNELQDSKRREWDSRSLFTASNQFSFGKHPAMNIPLMMRDIHGTF